MGDMRIGGVTSAFPTGESQRGASEPESRPREQASPVPEASEKESKSLAEMMLEAREKAEEQKERFKLPKSGVRYGDAPMEAYARLAKARNAAQVSAAAGYARRRIAQFKSAMRQDSENADQIKAAVNQLQKAVARAGRKKRDLERERLAEIQRARLEQDKELRRAQRVGQELQRRRMMRVIRESGYIREAEVDNRHQEMLAATRAELNAQTQQLSAPGATPVTEASSGAVPAAAGIDVMG